MRSPCRSGPGAPSRGSPGWWTVCRPRATRCRSGWCCTRRARWRRAPRSAGAGEGGGRRAQRRGGGGVGREAFAGPGGAGSPEQGCSGVGDSVRAPRYAVPVGLVLSAAGKVAQGAAVGGGGGGGGSLVRSGGVDKLFAPLKRWLQDFF